MHVCKFCEKEFSTGPKLGGHVSACRLNPIATQRSAKLSKAGQGRALSLEHREAVRASVEKRVADGTWHLSFSHARTHEYKGIKFHGTWEVEFAKFLDRNGVKWERCKESFPYEFEGKVHRYTPDFYVPESDVYIEIKGYRTPKDDAKWGCFPKKLLILRGEDLALLGLPIQYKSCS